MTAVNSDLLSNKCALNSEMAVSPLHVAVGNSKFVSSATGLETDEEGFVSRVHEIKTPKVSQQQPRLPSRTREYSQVERVLLRQYHQTREFVTGTLCLTDRHLIFVEPTGAQETWVYYETTLGPQLTIVL